VPANAGRLLVRSSPAGARVELDSQDVGVTPLTLRSLTIGTHSLRVTQDGYLPEERRVIITAAQPAQSLIVELVRRVSDASAAASSGQSGGAVRYTAPLVIESRPPGAAVFLNGRHVGTTPLTLEGVPAGSHALRLELDGYQRWTSAVRVAAGERNRITASLEQ
jgi:PEGA domain